MVDIQEQLILIERRKPQRKLCLQLYYTGEREYDNGGEWFKYQSECQRPNHHEGKCGPERRKVMLDESSY